MAGTRYIADPPDCYSRVALDGLTLFYHRRSGMTHLLAAPAPQLIDALAEPADLAELAARISEQFELEQADALEARLDELEAAGLVSRI